jgi:hypothetical protein
MSLYKSAFYKLEECEIDNLREAVYNLLLEVKEKEGREFDNEDEDEWTDFIHLATNSEEYAELANDTILPAMPQNPYGMVALINYINAHLIEDFGEDQAVSVWDSKGKNGLFQYTAIIIARNYFSTFQEFENSHDEF